MNVHKNARLTPWGRERAVKRVIEGETAAAVAESVGLSKSRLYKLIRRWKDEGAAGLQDRSARPERSPLRTSRARERHILRLRRKRWSGPRIADELKLPL